MINLIIALPMIIAVGFTLLCLAAPAPGTRYA